MASLLHSAQTSARQTWPGQVLWRLAALWWRAINLGVQPTLTVENQESEYTEFTVRLPV